MDNSEWMTRFISYTFHADQGTDKSKRDCRGHVRLFINAVLFRFTLMKILCEILNENRLYWQQRFFFFPQFKAEKNRGGEECFGCHEAIAGERRRQNQSSSLGKFYIKLSMAFLKGLCHEDVPVLGHNSALNSWLSAFTPTQMLLWSYEEDIKRISSRGTNHNNVLVIFAHTALKLAKVGPTFSSFNPC